MSAIYFYAKDEPYGELSNFAPFGIEMDGKWWPTVEHYFQAQKFTDPDYQEKIRKTPSAREAANLGRSRKLPVRADWEEIKEDIMFEAVLRKFETHARLRDLLLETGNSNLVENAPSDYFWGGGLDGSGQNKLGKILVKVRETLSSR